MQDTKSKIIVVDDEPNILLSIESCLDPSRFQVDSYSSIKPAYLAMQHQSYDCALIDIRLGHENGIALFKMMLSENIKIPVIFMSGNASLNEAVESQKLGAYDFIEKPFSAEKLNISIDNCVNYFKLKYRLDRIESSQEHHQLVGEHASIKQLKNELAKVSRTDVAVLIQGESGTGKELIARAIHQTSSRANNEMVIVNCSAIPLNLVESALFGHVKGAFTGADSSKKGYFEQAHQGTIFLDEIGDMPLSSQASLLRVLEAKEIQKVGSASSIKVDVRVIAATHKNLKEEIINGNFRQDLYYRLSVVPIVSPTLRERLSDLPQLVEYLIERLCHRHGFPLKNIHISCYEIFEQYEWPGNIRELANTLERMIIMGGNTLFPDDIPKDIVTKKCPPSYEISLKLYRESAERELIVNRLKHFEGNISQVARSLDIDRTNLHKKINLYNIQRDKDFY